MVVPVLGGTLSISFRIRLPLQGSLFNGKMGASETRLLRTLVMLQSQKPTFNILKKINETNEKVFDGQLRGAGIVNTNQTCAKLFALFDYFHLWIMDASHPGVENHVIKPS